MLDVSTFGYKADNNTIIHFIPYVYQHITVDRATAAVILLLPSGKPRQLYTRAFFKKYLKSFSLYWRKNYDEPLRSLFVAKL
jgi:hypothetical protein